MENKFSKSRITLAVVAAIGTGALATAPTVATAAKTPGKYVTGDFHNHTTCSDGSISMQKLVKKSTDKTDTPWGLDWFVQAGHGGNGNRNCTLVEDANLGTDAYPFVNGAGPNTTWQNTPAVVGGPIQPKGTVSGSSPNQSMWRWQSVQEFQYPLIEYLNAYKNLPLFLGIETVVPGHEHTSMSVITGQIPAGLDTYPLPASAGYTPLGNATALSQWEYCFDRNDTDQSRGNATVGTVPVAGGNNWNCSVPGSLNAADPSWNATAQKLIPAGGTGTGVRGHAKTVEALKWMAAFNPNTSYYAPAHLERAGPFNPDGNNGFDIQHLRDFNNTAPKAAFGFETQPGHGASDQRGEYTIRRNAFSTLSMRLDSVGGTTFGGTGVYGAQIGGVWDALLGEGRNWWFFASSDWHNRGIFGPDDLRSTQDFFPGEYQRDFVMVRNGSNPKLNPQMIVDGLRTGNSWTASGQLIDRLALVACASYNGPAFRSNAKVAALAADAALNERDIDIPGCANMGEKLVVRPGADIVVSIVVRDPSGTNYSPYSFPNPSLVQLDPQNPSNAPPLNKPVLHHVDVVRGMVTSLPKKPGDANYSGRWPTDWLTLNADGTEWTTPSNVSSVPEAAKNTTASLLYTYSKETWTEVADDSDYKQMTFRIPAVAASQYVRLRGTNLPASVPYETDASGNPLADLATNAAAVSYVSTTTPPGGSSQPPEYAAGHFLRIPCTTTGTNVPTGTTTYPAGSALIDGCPNHLPTVTNQPGVMGYPTGYTGKMVAYDVAAWADLWFYSNPIYVQVGGSTTVALDDSSVRQTLVAGQ